MKKRKTYLYLLIAVFILSYQCNQSVIRYTSNQIYSDIDNIPFRTCGLVLGTSKSGVNGLNPYFTYNMEAALELYNNQKVNQLILSGDNHIKGYNEPQDMCDYLVHRGVKRSDITLDYAGFRTLESVIRAKKVFKQTDVTIISQEFHNQRPLYIANHIDMNAIAFNAKDVSKRTNMTHFREYLAKVLVILDLHIFSTSPKFL